MQIYVDDIIFAGTGTSLGVEFAKLMSSKFEMSMMGELTFFLGLQIRQSPIGSSIHQQNYIKELLKRFHMHEQMTIDTRIGTTTKLDKDETGSLVNYTKYRGVTRSLLYLTLVVLTSCLILDSVHNLSNILKSPISRV